MKKLALALAVGLCLTSMSHAQTMAGYKFENYKVPMYQGKKAKLDYNSNSIAKMFKTRVTEAYHYRDGEVGFGGSYVVAMWGCGLGCISGAMIDKKTGNVYDLPLGEEGPYDGCYISETEDKRVNFEPNSRLFITRSCQQEDIEGTQQVKQKITYFVRVWDEKQKKFVKLKDVIQTKTVKADTTE